MAGIFAAFTLLYAAMALPVVWHYRGGIDWVLGKPPDDGPDDGETQ